MVLNIFIYSIFLALMLLTPLKFWERLYGVGVTILDKIQELAGRFGFGAANKNREDFWDALNEISYEIFLQVNGSNLKLPEYKFYTQLILKIIKLTREYGIGARAIIKEIKKEVLKDIQFEKRKESEVKNIYASFIVVIFMTWGFISLSCFYAGFSANSTVLYFILMQHLLGLFLFRKYLIWIQKKILDRYQNLFYSFYTFQSLMNIGLPLELVLQHSQIFRCLDILPVKLRYIEKRFRRSILRLQERGVSCQEDLRGLVDELWAHFDQSYHEFLKKIKVMKFLFLVIFYLSCHFLYLVSLFGDLFRI